MVGPLCLELLAKSSLSGDLLGWVDICPWFTSLSAGCCTIHSTPQSFYKVLLLLSYMSNPVLQAVLYIVNASPCGRSHVSLNCSLCLSYCYCQLWWCIKVGGMWSSSLARYNGPSLRHVVQEASYSPLKQYLYDECINIWRKEIDKFASRKWIELRTANTFAFSSLNIF